MVLSTVKEQSETQHNELRLDKQQAKTHLEALGYRSGDNIYMRAFFPSDDPRSVDDKGRKADKLNFKEVEEWQREGRGIYFVVNSGGHKNEDVKLCRAIFYEHDNLDKETQLHLWETLGLPEPTIQVDTGGKSIHSYWVFESHIPVEDWISLQTDLLEFADGDRSIKNPSRVMRLSGAWHIKANGTVNQSLVISNSGKRYSYEELRKIVPVPIKVQPSTSAQNHYHSHQEKWTDIDYAISYLSALHPSRADNYEDWLNVGMALKATNESLLSEWDRWSQQSSKYKPGVCEKKWDSFKSCGINLGTLGHMANEDGWKSPFKKDTYQRDNTNNKQSENNIINHPSFNPLSESELERRLDELINASLPKSKLEIEIATLSKHAQISDRTIWRIYREKEKEIEQQENRQDNDAEIERLLQAKAASLDITSIIPKELAEPINQLASWLNLKPECYLTALLATTSTLHKTGTKLIIHEGYEFEVSPNLFAAIVAPSSQKKSPILKTITKKPLGILQQKAREEYKDKIEEYNDLIKEYDNCKDKEERAKKFPGGRPKEPRLKLYSFTQTTGEGLITQLDAHPQQGLLLLSDELSGYFKSANQYRKGKGSDEEDLLSYYDGSGATILRASGIKADVDQALLGILGAIQPAVLQSFLQDCSDDNGKWARFIFVSQPAAASELYDDFGDIGLSSKLAQLYQQLDQLPPMEYRLSKDAFEYYQKAYNRLEQLRVSDSSSGMSSMFGKSEGRIGKIAINLHVVSCLLKGQPVTATISKKTIVAATELTNFYIQQVQSLYSEFAEPDALATHLAKVVEFANKRGGWIKAKDFVNSITPRNRPDANQARQWFIELEAMGRGVTRGVGRTLEFSLSEKADESRQGRRKVDESSTTENIATTGFETKVDKVDEVDDSSNPPWESPPDTNDGLIEDDSVPDKKSISSTSSTLSTNGCNAFPELTLAVDDSSTNSSTSSTFAKTSTITITDPTQQPKIVVGCKVRWLNAPHFWGDSPARVTAVSNNKVSLEMWKNEIPLDEVIYFSAS